MILNGGPPTLPRWIEIPDGANKIFPSDARTLRPGVPFLRGTFILLLSVFLIMILRVGISFDCMILLLKGLA